MIEAKLINKSYGNKDNKVKVLHDINLTIKSGEFVVILGASGSGKTTLLNVLSGLEYPDYGSVLYEDKDITLLNDKELTEFRKNNIGFVFQQYYLLSNMTIKSNIKMGADLANNKDFNDIIVNLDLTKQLQKYPFELSGGQQQRVSIARALAKKPKVLFMDEPTGALDEKSGKEVLNYLLKIHHESKLTIIMVTHNQNIANLADTIISMNSGHIVDIKQNANKKNAFEIGW